MLKSHNSQPATQVLNLIEGKARQGTDQLQTKAVHLGESNNLNKISKNRLPLWTVLLQR